MNPEICVWLHDLIPNKNGFLASVQISGKLDDKPIDVRHFAYRKGRLKQLGSYKDCPAPLFVEMLKYAEEIFKTHKGQKIILQSPPNIPT